MVGAERRGRATSRSGRAPPRGPAPADAPPDGRRSALTDGGPLVEPPKKPLTRRCGPPFPSIGRTRCSSPARSVVLGADRRPPWLRLPHVSPTLMIVGRSVLSVSPASRRQIRDRNAAHNLMEYVGQFCRQ